METGEGLAAGCPLSRRTLDGECEVAVLALCLRASQIEILSGPIYTHVSLIHAKETDMLMILVVETGEG